MPSWRMFGVPLLEIAGGGDPPLAARGGAGAISSIHIPIPYSDPYLDSTFTTTTQFILKCQDQPDNTTTF